MNRCKNDIFLQKIGKKKLNNKVEVDFEVNYDLPDCNRINTRNHASLTGGTATFNSWKIPADAFDECFGDRCTNSGTLFLGSATAVYNIAGDATEYAAGAITFYVIAPAGSTVNVTLSKYNDSANANVYAVPVNGTKKVGDFNLIAIDLAKAPTSVEGEGWTPAGVTSMKVQITGTDVTAENTGISSIAVFDELEVLANNHVVKVGCLSSIDGDFAFEAAEATCFNPARYQDEDLSFEKTVTGASVTPNYGVLNPLMRRNDRVTDFDIVTIQRTLVESNGYCAVELADLDTEECGNISAALADVCVATDAMLTRIAFPSAPSVDEGHFYVDRDTKTIIFNAVHAGAVVTISYPRKVNVIGYDLDADNLEGVRTRMTYAREMTDGTKWRFVYNNVLITSFPASLSNEDDAEFEFSVAIQKDKDGKIGRAYRILDGAVID